MKKKRDIKRSLGTDGKDKKICARNKTREITKISMGGRKIKFCESYYQLYKEGRGYKKFGKSDEKEIQYLHIEVCGRKKTNKNNKKEMYKGW